MSLTATTPGQSVLESASGNIERVDFQRGQRIEYKDRAKLPLASYIDKRGSSMAAKTDRIILFSGDLILRRHAYSGGTVTGVAGDTGDITITTHDNQIVVGMLLNLNAGTGADGGNAGVLFQVDSIVGDVFTGTNLSGGAPAATGFAMPIGFASLENATVGPTFVQHEPHSVYGYLTILKWKIEMSITERDSKVYAATSREQELIERSRMDFMRVRETSFWLSRATSNVTGKVGLRTSMGLHEQVVTGSNNVVDGAGALLSDAMLGQVISDGALYFDNTRFSCFHGANALNGLFQLGSGKVLTDESDDMYGYTAQSVGVAQYRMDFVHSQIFDVAGDPFTSMLLGIDMNSVEDWYKGGEGQMQLKKNTDPKAYAEGEVLSHMWRSQEGLTTTVPERHFAIKDLGTT